MNLKSLLIVVLFAALAAVITVLILKSLNLTGTAPAAIGGAVGGAIGGSAVTLSLRNKKKQSS